jgi:hypothetical protein
MGGLALTDLEGQADAIGLDRYMLYLLGIPGVSDSTDLIFGVDSVTYPGTRISVIEWKIAGHTRRWRGAQTPGDGRVQVTFTENVNMSIYQKLSTWNNDAVDPETGNCTPGWQITAALDVFDTTGAVADSVTFYGLWCEEVQATTLNGQSSTLMQITATLCYDYFL